MTDHADPFNQMATRIEGTDENEFAGAVCIVAPDGVSIEYMLTDPKRDPIFFWLGLKSRIETQYAELEQKQREQEMARGMFGRR